MVSDTVTSVAQNACKSQKSGNGTHSFQTSFSLLSANLISVLVFHFALNAKLNFQLQSFFICHC